MEFILKLIIGFIIMCILIGISAIPIFIMQHYKKNCSIILRWFLFILCILIYIILSVTCQHYGILTERKGIPLTPLIILSVLAGVNLFNAKESTTQDNTEQEIDYVVDDKKSWHIHWSNRNGYKYYDYYPQYPQDGLIPYPEKDYLRYAKPTDAYGDEIYKNNTVYLFDFI